MQKSSIKSGAVLSMKLLRIRIQVQGYPRLRTLSALQGE